MAGQYFSDTEIDEILGAVEETMQNAANLAKGGYREEQEDAPEMGQEGAPEMAPEMGQQPVAPEMGQEDQGMAPEMGQEEQGMAPEEQGYAEEEQGMEPEMGQEEQGYAEEGGDEALEGENGELSDDELHQIYASMEPQDLERHYMIIRSMLRDAYAKMEKSEKSTESNKEKVEDMAKNEEYETKISQLEKSNVEMQQSLEAAIKAVELIHKPERKAVTSEVQVLGKTESDVAGQNTEGEVDFSSLSKSDITAKLNEKVRDPKLSKSDREAINGYLLSGSGKEEIIKLLGSK